MTVDVLPEWAGKTLNEDLSSLLGMRFSGVAPPMFRGYLERKLAKMIKGRAAVVLAFRTVLFDRVPKSDFRLLFPELMKKQLSRSYHQTATKKHDSNVREEGTLQGANVAKHVPELKKARVLGTSTAPVVDPASSFQAVPEATRPMQEQVVKMQGEHTVYLSEAPVNALDPDDD